MLFYFEIFVRFAHVTIYYREATIARRANNAAGYCRERSEQLSPKANVTTEGS
jgi:hypothetical protein